MNDCYIMGNLARDPEIKCTASGGQYARFSVGCNRSYKGKDGNMVKATDWVNVVAWGNLAEGVGNYLTKGRLVLCHGRWSSRSYDDASGQRRYITEFVADVVSLPVGLGKATAAPAQPSSPAPAEPPCGAAGFAQFGQPTQQYQQQAMFPPGPSEEIPF